MTHTAHTPGMDANDEPLIAEVTVRNFRRDDMLGVHHIEQWLDERWDTHDHLDFMKRSNNCTAVAVAGSHVYGFVCVTVSGRHVLVERLAVLPEVRRNGVGTFLIGCVEKSFGGGRTLQTLVGEYDVGSQLFLKACGWKWVKTIAPLGDGCDNYLMEKQTVRGGE